MTKPLDALAQDLAVDAWNRASQDSAEPTSIEIVSDAGFPLKTAIYRLREAGPGGMNVIAKRSRLHKVAVERAVYEGLLPPIPVRSLAFLGSTEEQGSKFAWLFLEDAQGEPFSRDSDEHRALGDRWLAGLHTGAAELDRPESLPGSGPSAHFPLVGAARKGVTRALLMEDLDAADEALLTASLHQLDLLERRWVDIGALCSGVPETLQHGDFAGKNLIVDPNGSLVPVDWEAAAWGPPAIDLVFVDPARYHAAVSERWPELTVESIERAALAGRCFRQLSALRWATRDYPAERAKRKLEEQHRKLADVLETAGLS